MSVEIKIPTINGITLNTKNKYVKDDITLSVDIPRYDGSADGGAISDIEKLFAGEITEYFNDRIITIQTGFSNNNIIKKVDLPNVVTVGNRVFLASGNLTTINIPKAETLGIATFGSTTSLENALLWNVTTIQNQCFQNSGVKILIAPKLTSVGTQFCNGANKLEIAVLDNVTAMQGGMGFYNCKELKAVIIKQDTVVPPLTTNVFQASSVASGTGFVYVPDSKVEEYKVATNWSSIANQIKGLSEIPQEILDELEGLGYGN